MWAQLLLCALSLAGFQEPPPPPDPALVKAAIAELDSAFAKGKSPERIAAIGRAATLLDPAVIDRIARGLKDGDPLVQSAAVEALRFLQHADALAALSDCAKRDKKLAKDGERFAALIKAIGQHASPTSIAWLAEGALAGDDFRVIEARLLALGNIRTRAALEALVGLMRAADRERVQPYMPSFRLALMVLTGADQGVSQDAWIAWWNEHKATLAVEPAAPPLPKELQLRWDAYWGRPMLRERGKKRGERGDDPEGGGK